MWILFVALLGIDVSIATDSCCRIPETSGNNSAGLEPFLNFILSSIANPLGRDKYEPQTALQRIQNAGFIGEEHHVTTKDGYVLTIFRIRREIQDGCLPIVFLQHGLFSCSDHWLIQEEACVLAFLLVKSGFDVWLGNARGNNYSRNHTSLTTADPKFWNCSWHEMGKFDLPAVIDYIFKITGCSQFCYLGHSMGTTMYFVMASEEPAYLSKIKCFIAFAPVSFLPHVRGLMKEAAPVLAAAGTYDLLIKTGFGEFFPEYFWKIPFIRFFNDHFPAFCDEENTGVCFFLFFAAIMGPNFCNMNKNLTRDIIGTMPRSSSLKSVCHFADLMSFSAGSFRPYKKGLLDMPLNYNVANADRVTPSFMYIGSGDFLATKEDNYGHLKPYLPNAKFITLEPDCFSHLDFLWAADLCNLLYYDVVNKIKEAYNMTVTG